MYIDAYYIIIIIIIIEFVTSQLWLERIHLSWDVVINRIRLGGLICSLKSFLQLNMCQELQIFAVVYMYSVGRVAQSVLRLTTGWTVRDRIPVGTRFSAGPDRPWGPPSLL